MQKAKNGVPLPVVTESEVRAIRAMTEGTASAEQQRMGMAWIGREACMMLDMSFTPDGRVNGMTDFHEGRRFVGWMLRHLMTPEALKAAMDYDQAQRRG